MADLTKDERDAGKMLANNLDDLADDAPNVFAERLLRSTAYRLRRHFGYSRNLKRAEILKRVQREPLGITVADLQKDLGFHIDDVRSIVQSLESDRKVCCKKVSPGGSKGGRPTTLVSIYVEQR